MQKSLMERQVALEVEASAISKANVQKLLGEAAKDKRFDRLAGVKDVLKAVTGKYASEIEAFLLEASTRPAGRLLISAKLLKGMDPHVVAFVAARAAFNEILMTSRRPLTSVAMAVGSQIEFEAKLNKFASENPKMFKLEARRQQKLGSTTSHKERAYRVQLQRNEIEWNAWSKNDKVQLGTKLLELLQKSTGTVEFVKVVLKPPRTQHVVVPAESILRWVQRGNERAAILRPRWFPTLVPPKPWGEGEFGGYFTPASPPLRLVKPAQAVFKQRVNALNTPDDCPVMYEALNAVQETGWKLNKRVLDVAIQFWEAGEGGGIFPKREDAPLPPKPNDIDINEFARKEWRREAAEVYNSNAESRGERLGVERTLEMAKRFSQEECFWFPHQLDFRGRQYVVPGGLSPQGSDLSKALLLFSESKRLQDNNGQHWLMIHGANVRGDDKLAFEDRMKATQVTTKTVVAIANDPFANRQWMDAKKPWQYLAFCFEWAEYLTADDQESYQSCLPVFQDGTCNGLQHYSAMLRDEEGGAAVNLLPMDEPQDIYGVVAELAMEMLREASLDPENTKAWIAHRWHSFGLNRDTTKLATMTMVYNATFDSCQMNVKKAIFKEIKDGNKRNPFGEELSKHVSYLAGFVWKAVHATVDGASAAMRWLSTVGRMLAQEGHPLKWTTPAGFTCVQAYPNTKPYRVATRLGEGIVRLNLREPEENTLSVRDQSRSFPPNFVHSMDAAALAKTVVASKAAGITSFAMVHDAYGTHASDADAMANILRSVFVEMYEYCDPLGEIYRYATGLLPDGGIPQPPATGELDLREILRSPYFFC